MSWPITAGATTAARGAEIYAAYLEKITSYVLWLLDRGHRVRVLMGDEADRRAVDDLLEPCARGGP